MNTKSDNPRKTIAVNKRARFEYHIEERLEAGIALEGTPAAYHFVHHAAHRKDVSTGIGGKPLYLLGRHIRHRPHHDAWLRL